MKTTIYLLLTLLFVTATSCEVNVPDTDREDPAFAFRVSGDGFDHTFQSKDDFDGFVLYMRRGYKYDFLFSGGDSGGLKDLQWLWFNRRSGHIDTDIPYENIIEEGWILDPNGYAWFIGTIENPLSGAIISGSFTPGGRYPIGMMDFNLLAEDFGGLNGDRNSVVKVLKVVIGDHPTEIVPVN